MRITLVILALLTVTGCFGRANPRVSKMTRTQGGSKQITTFDYDDAGHPSEVSTDFGGGVTQSYTFDFDGAHVSKITLKHEAGGGATTDKIDVEYDGDRVTKSTADLGDSDQSVTTTIDYDGDGHVQEVVRKTDFGSGTDTETSTFEYKDGALKSITDKSEFQQTGQDANVSKSSFDVAFKDGKLDTIDFSDDRNNSATISATYKDGALDKLDFEGKQDGQDVTGKDSFDYKDGLLTGSTAESNDSDDTVYDLEYDDGDAVDVDMTPSAVLLFGMWDLRGASYTALDARTQAVRLAGASW